MSDAFHDDDSLDIAEQLLVRSEAINAQLRAIIAKHRAHAPRITTHDGSLPGSPCMTCSDEPPARDV